MLESPGPEVDQDGPLPLDHPFVAAVSRLDLDRLEEMLTADPGLVDADLHGRAWIGGPRRTAAGWDRAPDQTSRAVHLAAYGHAALNTSRPWSCSSTTAPASTPCRWRA